MTGIRERRFFPPGTKPSTMSIESARKAIDASGIDSRYFGALIHGSVCRDFVEPATACGVHDGLDLPADAMIYDVSNACLGLLNGMLQVANMIELGQIRAGVVVGTECGRSLVDNTIELLNTDASFTRETVKEYIASLTIGAASAAIVLCDEDLSGTGNRLTTAVVHCDTSQHELCQSRGLDWIMQTDSEALMRRGVAAGTVAFHKLLAATGWEPDDIDHTFCHQVGVAHRKLMFESMGLNTAIDFSTFETLGNTGTAALPVSMALGIERGVLSKGDHVALLGIGSGINSVMMAVDWQTAPLHKIPATRAVEENFAV
jgi:acyl-CoA:acyl-CoA alkyltransferase